MLTNVDKEATDFIYSTIISNKSRLVNLAIFAPLRCNNRGSINFFQYSDEI